MNRKIRNVFLLIFGSMGLVFLLLGLGFLGYFQSETADMVKVPGTIIDFIRDGDPLVRYTFDGETYIMEGSTSSSSQHLGSPYEIYVDPVDPQRAMDNTFQILGYVFSGLGGLFLLSGIILYFALGAAAQSREALLGYGHRVIATVISVDMNRSVSYGSAHPYVVTAECTHPLTGQTVRVKSHQVWKTSLQPGDRVEVAFHPSNEKKHAFDLPEDSEK